MIEFVTGGATVLLSVFVGYRLGRSSVPRATLQNTPTPSKQSLANKIDQVQQRLRARNERSEVLRPKTPQEISEEQNQPERQAIASIIGRDNWREEVKHDGNLPFLPPASSEDIDL